MLTSDYEAEVWMLQYRMNAQPKLDAAHANEDTRNAQPVIPTGSRCCAPVAAEIMR